jgi:hypothetical protein
MLGGLSVGFEGSFRGVYFCTLHFAARVRRRSCGVNSWGLSQKGQREGGVVRLNLKTEMAEGESAAVNVSTRLPAARVASPY